MHSTKTRGIVLKSLNFDEADKILVIFTERFGKIRAIAKGVRKIKSKLAGSLEPFMILDLQLHEGKTFYIITGSVIINEFPNLHENLKNISKIFYLGELIDKFSGEGEKNNEVFDLFAKILELSEKCDNDILIRAFELKLLLLSGFHPELYECIHCKKKISPGNNYWDHVEGGLICEACNQDLRHGNLVSDNLIKITRYFEREDFVVINQLKVTKSLENESKQVLGGYIEHILERELKSKRFLEML